MSDFPKFVVFGSFTEEETRKFQKNSVESQKSSSQTTRLQFGSLDFNTVLSSRNLNSESKGADFSRRSDRSSASSPVSKVDVPKITNAAEPAKAKKVVASQANGSAGKCIPNLKLIEKDAVFSQKSDSSSTSSSVSKDDALKMNAAKPAKPKDVFASQANGSASRYIPNLKSIENVKVGISFSSICISDENKTSDAINRDADIDSSKDATESSSESEFYLHSPNSVSSSGDFSKRSAHNCLNGENAAVKPLLPRGLINSGNLCFLNTTLQALLSCAPFVHLLQDLRASDVPKTVYPTVHAFVEFIANFDMPNDLISKMTEQPVIETGSSFLPAMFESVLGSFTPDLPFNMSSRPRQEDAQEFLSFVLDRLHDELLRMDGYRPDSSGGLSSLVSSQEDDGWETVGPKNKSAVTRTQSFMPSKLSNIFSGELKSIVKARGNTASATVQPFFLLHLDIFPDAVHNIQDALNLFALPEPLEGYKTSGGKAGVVSASKDLKIQKLSKILILHLMRFSYGNRGSAKLHKPVHFPLEFVLRRNLLASPTSESRKYELVATITHHGRDPSKGHYTADARYSNGIWLRYDDASVTAVPASKVLHDQAYVLFYRQV